MDRVVAIRFMESLPVDVFCAGNARLRIPHWPCGCDKKVHSPPME
jgi:hypothetical protein